MFNWWGQRYSTVGFKIFFFRFKAEHMVRPGIQIKVQISSNKTGHSQGSLDRERGLKFKIFNVRFLMIFFKVL